MVRPGLTVGFIGHMPPLLGGGGLEIQMWELAAALNERGVTVVDAYCPGDAESVDVLHAFSTEPNIWHTLRNWSRGRCALVVTPTLVLDRRGDFAARLLSRMNLGIATSVSMRRDVLRQAALVLCLTTQEMKFCSRWLGVAPEKAAVLGNGTSVVGKRGAPSGDGPVVLIGAITQRKRQAEVLEAIGGDRRVVVAGHMACSADYEARFKAVLNRANAEWLGGISRAEVYQLLEKACALVLFSRAEGESLAVLDALAMGVPVVLSDIPVHRDLRDRYPRHVHLVKRASEIRAALAQAGRNQPPRPNVPTWNQVAEKLTRFYETVA